MPAGIFTKHKLFQSTPPARGATALLQLVQQPPEDFNPRPPRGGRQEYAAFMEAQAYFNPRPPRGGRRWPPCSRWRSARFQSTPPARGATLLCISTVGCMKNISIHAPREGGDFTVYLYCRLYEEYFNPRPPRGGRLDQDILQCWKNKISIHAPREGGDLPLTSMGQNMLIFQSTPPARGATCHAIRYAAHFS